MRCISIRQPWAWLICQGVKNVENRTWKSPYRGELAIHASQKFDWGFFDLESPFFDRAMVQVCEHFGIGSHERITAAQHEFSAVVGSVELVDIIAADNNKPVSSWCVDGGYWWLLANPKNAIKPFPCKGKLNIWNIDIPDGFMKS